MPSSPDHTVKAQQIHLRVMDVWAKEAPGEFRWPLVMKEEIEAALSDAHDDGDREGFKRGSDEAKAPSDG